jgi:hypothetical protein
MKYLPFKKQVLLDNHQMLTLYSIGWLALLTKRRPVTLRLWESQGVLPKPIFDGQLSEPFRYYTAGELMGYAKVINTYSQRRRPGYAFSAEMKAKLHDFRVDLKKTMTGHKNLVLKLPDEAQIESAVKAGSDDKQQRRTANALLKASGI